LEVSEQRVIASLLLLLGVTALIVGLHSGQMDFVWKILNEVFKTAIAGAP